MIPNSKSMLVFGGCSGYNLILNDTYIFDLSVSRNLSYCLVEKSIVLPQP